MADKKLKLEKKMFRYTERIIRRVDSYGYGKDNKYKSKPNSVCYGTKEGGNFVSYDKNKFQNFMTKLRWQLKYYIRIRFIEDFLGIERKRKEFN